MRLLFYFSLVLLIACACTSEQTSQNTPEEAVKGLFGALKNNDFETARLYGTTSTQSCRIGVCYYFAGQVSLLLSARC